MERGCLLKSGTVMVEPAVMWRPVTSTMQAPEKVPLLHVCRIRPHAATSTDTLARPSCSLTVRTASGQEHVFECASQEARDCLVEQWKLCVARFAALAVLEDATAILSEFFTVQQQVTQSPANKQC
jgi:hypothetical protein